uniref:Spatacsin C-terminal domain-containing protein n=1 Tax=Culex tarsalis TaxID=7177 RepID=A0A1Q3FGT2_CULTA
MPPERDIIIRGWEKLDDDVIIKDVATKGKHVNLCVYFLAQRNELSQTEAKNYFLQKVNAYVYRLLANRQLYKAEHILSNIDRTSKYVFYQIAAETSDHGLRDYIRDHLRRTIEDYDGESGEGRLLDANWRVYCLLKKNATTQLAELLRVLEPGYSVLEIETMSFNTFYAKEEAYRNAVALDMFFKNQETEISPLLDKHAVWGYLLRNNIDNLVKIWIQINACLRVADQQPGTYSADVAKIKIDIYDDPRFNERLRQLFRRWEINDFMVSQLSGHKSMTRNEVLLNVLATYGKFVDHERGDALAVLRRLFTTQTVEVNGGLLEEKVFREGLTRHLVENRLFQLMDLSVVSEECLQRLAEDENCDNRKEVEMFMALRGLKEESISREGLLKVSRKSSEYLLGTQENFYDENPIMFLFEHFLDPSNVAFPDDDQQFWKLGHLRSFLARLKDNPASIVSAKELMNLHELPCLEAIRSNLFKDRDETCDEEEVNAKREAILREHGYVPHFNHPVLCEKYSTEVKLNYLHYIKQQRSCYALYLFYVDQLRNYARITPQQINCAARSASEVALKHYSDANLVSHCTAFIEMLGVDSSRTRAYVRCLNMINESRPGLREISTVELIEQCEDVLFTRTWNDPNLLQDLEAMTTVCRASQLGFPEKYLKQLLNENDWFRFLLLVEYLDYPQDQVLALCKSSFRNATIGSNAMRAIKYYTESAGSLHREATPTSLKKRNSWTPKKRRRGSSTSNAGGDSHSSVSSESDIQSSTTTTNRRHSTISESSLGGGVDYDGSRYLTERYDRDLFATVLLCANEADSLQSSRRCALDFDGFRQLMGGRKQGGTFGNLLDRAVVRRWPLLAVLAGMVAEGNRKYCWITWLMVSIEYPFQEKLKELSEVEFVQDLLEFSVRKGYVQMLQDSISLFYADSNLYNLAKYLVNSTKLDFSQCTTDHLRHFLLNAGDCPLLGLQKLDMIAFGVKLLTLHVDNNFNSLYQQTCMLETLVSSDINCFTQKIDFVRLLKFCNILKSTTVRIAFIDFFDREDLHQQFEALCERLVSHKAYKQAIEIAELSGLPRDSIIFEHWISDFEANEQCDFVQYQTDMIRYDVGPELLLNFYIHIANRLEYGNRKKYDLLKRALELIKQHGLYPSQHFDRDRLEYELVLAYVKCSDHPATLDLYHSHFFSNTFKRDGGILYHTFMELKEVAGIDDLTVSNLPLEHPTERAHLDGLIHRLLKQGDIVQALRYQAIFEQRPYDLHFVVFCMGLAESVLSLYNLSKEERLLLNEDCKRISLHMQRRTLRLSRLSQCSGNTSVGSPARLESSDTSAGASEFEEVPSRDKQNVLEAINGLGAKIQFGQELAQRVILTYRIAMYLDREYNEILKIRDPVGFLEEVIREDCFNKLEVISDIMTSHRMNDTTISCFLAKEIVIAVVRSKFYMLQQGSPLANAKPIDELLWGYNIDREFHLFLELAPNTTMLGNCLLKYCDAIKYYKRLEKSPDRASMTESVVDEVEPSLLDNLKEVFKNQILSLKKQNTIIVALLVKAHDCFVHECSVEGIVEVLQRCKSLNNVLTSAKSWNLIVKLLVGIGRYREMYYCFETLIKNDQFESLLGQFDEKHTNGLKTAIISYLHEHCPEQKEFFRLAALHFLMYKEIAEMWETEAKSSIAKVLSVYELRNPSTATSGSPKISMSRLICDPLAISELNSALESYTHATENYLLDNKLNLAQKTASNAELVALQLCLIEQAKGDRTNSGEDSRTCISVLNIKKDEKGSNLAHFINNALSVPQALIISRTYEYEINWTQALYQHYIVNGESAYLDDYLDRMPLTDEMVESLVKTFQLEPSVTPEMERAIAALVEMVDTVTLKYRLASLLGLKRTIHELINENSFYYLKDCDYGRSENVSMGS